MTSFSDGVSNFAEGAIGGLAKSMLGSENTRRALSSSAAALLETIEKTAQRSYINSGFANAAKSKPNGKTIISQSPESIVLIKKKMFSSIAENFDASIMDKDERFFIRAAKKLFENKCNEIANYEKLTKLNDVIKKYGVITSPMANIILSTINGIEGSEFNEPGGGWSGFVSIRNELIKHPEAMQKIRQALLLGGFEATTTTWLSDSQFEKPQSVSLGRGTGVIELTIVNSWNATNSIDLGGGSARITIPDPYHIMFITEEDIEKAIYQSSYSKFNLINYIADELDKNNASDLQYLNYLRGTRGASPITVKINIQTRVYNRVQIILDRIGVELTKPDGSGLDETLLYRKDAQPPKNVPRFEMLSQEETEVVERLYKNTFLSLTNRAKDYEDFRDYNFGTTYVRNQMRKFFLSKQLIQHQDIVTIFCDSQKIDDVVISSAIKKSFMSKFNTSGNNPVMELNKAMGDLKKFTNPGAGFDSYAVEKNILTGDPNFPDWLYNTIRTNLNSGSFGTCVFCGIVDSVGESYSDGAYRLSISCKDNSYNFEQGYINTKPAMEQYNGFLYDPVTPFDFEFDEASGLPFGVSSFKLLPENLDRVKANTFRFDGGKNRGEKVTEKNIIGSEYETKEALSSIGSTYSDLARRVINIPSGMVYRWKSGIGTAIFNQSGTTDGLVASRLLTEKYGNVVLENPFGGQDMINVLSLLICGQPYNLAAFIQSALNFQTLSVDTGFGNQSADYFTSLMKQISKQNRVWGNFIPFQKYVSNEETFGKMMAMQLFLSANSSSIIQKQQRKAELMDKILKFEGDSFEYDPAAFHYDESSAGSGRIKIKNRAVIYPLLTEALKLDVEIDYLQRTIRDSVYSDYNTSVNLSFFGSSVSADPVQAQSSTIGQYEKMRYYEQNSLTKRRLWQVRANIDSNLFIVGNEYNTDYDLRAIMNNLSGNFDFVDTSWNKIKDKIQEIIRVVGLEIFANSQGHIEVRAPKYNRIPSSVLWMMFKKKQERNIQIYPNFLEKMFKVNIDSTLQEIEILEDTIRLNLLALGVKYDSDKSLAEYLKGSTFGKTFRFVTDANGSIKGLKDAVSQLYPDYGKSNKNNPQASGPWYKAINPIDFAEDSKLSFFDKNAANAWVYDFKVAADTTNEFDVITQIENFNKFKRVGTDVNMATEIRKRIAQKSGRPIDAIETIESMTPNSTKNGVLSPLDVNAITSNLNRLISDRHSALINAMNNIKNLDDANKVNSYPDDMFRKLLLPKLFGSEGVPEFMRDLVEVENEDDYGRGSGSRYVIRESDIKSMDYNESGPEFCSVEVTGSEMGGLVGDAGFQVGEIKLSYAKSVDYDLWRMYGYKDTSQTKHLPFLSNPELQLAPYAVYMLNMEREKLFRASLNLVGDENKQAGDVYYVEGRGMLFYAKSVTHSFTYGGEFGTSLDMTFGHVPGEYIPTPLDIIGKNLYKGQSYSSGSYRIARPETDDSGKTNIGTLIYSPNNNIANNANIGPITKLKSGEFGKTNEKELLSIVAKLNSMVQTTAPSEGTSTSGITIRVYYDSSKGGPDKKLTEVAKGVIDYLVGGKGFPKTSIIGSSITNPAILVYGSPMFVDTSNKNKVAEPRNPSSSALSNLSNQVNEVSGVSDSKDAPSVAELKNNLIYKIIDVWYETDITPTINLVEDYYKANPIKKEVQNSKGKYQEIQEKFNKIDTKLEDVVGLKVLP